MLAVLGGMAYSASAQVVGFYDLSIFTGNNLIANQLTTGGSDTLDTVLNNGVPNGATFTEFNTAANQLEPVSTFNSASATWSIDYPFAPNGIGGVLNSPVNGTIAFGGDVINLNGPGGTYSFTPANIFQGTYLLALAAPLDNATFAQIVGRNPVAGESVETLNGATQTMTTTTFNGTTWNNGTPSLATGQAAYFNLTVPEPSTYALLGVGAAMLFFSRRLRSRNFRA